MESVFMAHAAQKSAHLLMLANTERLWINDDRPNMQLLHTLEQVGRDFKYRRSATCFVKAASNVGSPGYRTIVDWKSTTPDAAVAADGVIIDANQRGGVVMQTADCLTIVISNNATRKRGVYHCGRPAGMPYDDHNIMTDMLQLVAENGTHDAIEVTAIGGISGQYFEHHDGPGKTQALAYLEQYGPEVFYDVDCLALDMRKVVTKVHTEAGVLLNNIRFVGPDCTYSTPCCASHRRSLVEGVERTTANTIMYMQ